MAIANNNPSETSAADAIQRELAERFKVESFEIPPGMLKPDALANYEKQKVANPDLKLYWVSHYRARDKAKGNLSDGTPVFLATNLQVYPTEQMIAAGFPKSESFRKYSTTPDEALLRDFSLLAQKSGIDPTPTLIILTSNAPRSLQDKAPATLPSREGEIFIYLNPDDAQLPHEQILGILAHELGHVKNGHVSFAAYLNSNNHGETPEQSRRDEDKADIHVANLCLGKELALYFVEHMQLGALPDNIIESRLPLTAYRQPLGESDLHPPYINRVDNLLQTHWLLVEQGYCPAGDPPPPGATPTGAKPVDVKGTNR